MRSMAPLRSAARQRGVTLVELMIALVLGALVVLAATAMVVSSRATYRTQDEGTRIAESARFGLELGNRLVRLAGFTNWGFNTTTPASYTPDPAWTAAPDAYAVNGPNIVGADNSKPGGAAGLNGSDSLTLRFFGSNKAFPSTVADGNVLDCAGVPVPDGQASSTSATTTDSNAQRSFNTLYVDTDSDGEPSLWCKRQTYDATTGLPTGSASQVLIRGVEDFQVLYGEYIPPVDATSGLPLSLDDVPPQNIVYRAGVGGNNPVGNWANVRSVRISMLLRSNVGARPDPEPTTATYAMFGAGYPNTGNDPGSSFALTGMSLSDRTRARRIVQTTVFVRNRENGWGISVN
jgi:type IV pilus assembly protein PilW